MVNFMRWASTLASALFCAGGTLLASLPACAQDQVLKGQAVTEDALVSALAIDAPDMAASGTTRGFRPAAGTQRSRPQAGPGRTSLLITFLPDSATLLQDSKGVLDTVARALQSDRLAGFSFRVEGHADPRGPEDHNRVLSEERAHAVVDYLTTQHGILPERLTSLGKGSSEPLNKTQPAAPENRRVTIITNRN